MKSTISKAIIIILLIGATIGFFYGCYWVAKTVSYKVFYEDMVQNTVVEMVKTEALK